MIVIAESLFRDSGTSPRVSISSELLKSNSDPVIRKEGFNQLKHSFLYTNVCQGNRFRVVFGGAERDRTADLLRARQALSQLSYSPLVAKNFADLGAFKRSVQVVRELGSNDEQRNSGGSGWT